MHFLFVDKILQLLPGESIKGIKHVTFDDYYLSEDVAGNLSFMPSLVGETLGQLAAWNVMQHNGFTKRPVAGVASSARIYRPARPGETLLLESFIDTLNSEMVAYHSQATIDNELVFTLEGALGPLLPMEDFIAREVVQKQFEAINRPGVWPPVFPATKETIRTNPHRKGIAFTFDHILDFQPGERIMAEKRISRSAPWIQDHFPFKPVLPMTILMECKIHLARDFLLRSGFSANYILRELRKIKMNEFVQPGNIVICTIMVKSCTDTALVLGFRSEVAGKRVCTLEMLFET